MALHEQVWVKVNATADAGVCSLVGALSAFSELQTLESCQGAHGWAWVTFVYGQHWRRPWQGLAKFVLGFVGPALARELGDRVRLSIQVTGGGPHRAEMAVQYAAIPAAVKVLTELRAESEL
ncbi:MAG: hypothetical protein ACRD2E_04345 [Terriglobales bacterium]